MASVITLFMPEYTIDREPEYEVVGRGIDQVIEENFAGEIVIRALSITDHPQLTVDELADIILETGTDKYDPSRKGVCYEAFEPYAVDLQGGRIVSEPGTVSEGADIIRKFYENAPLDRGYPLRIDLLSVYDASQLVQAAKIDKDAPGVHPRLEPYLFRFKNLDRKKQALLGVIKIPR